MTAEGWRLALHILLHIGIIFFLQFFFVNLVTLLGYVTGKAIVPTKMTQRNAGRMTWSLYFLGWLIWGLLNT